MVILNNASQINIGEQVVNYTNYRGQQRGVAADHVIVAKGATGDTTLAEQFNAAGISAHAIGDATGVTYIEGAIEDAAKLAVEL